MQYLKSQNGDMDNGVGISFSINYPRKPDAGVFWQHARLCVAHALQQDTAISDLEIIIREINSAPKATTDYSLIRKKYVAPNGSKPLSNIIPRWAKTLTEETVLFACSNIHPCFNVFISTAYNMVRDQKCISTYVGEVKIRDPRGYIPRQKVTYDPVAQNFELGTALVLAKKSSQGSVSGKVEYELKVEAVTHHLPRSLGPTGVGNPTGTVSESCRFIVDWQ